MRLLMHLFALIGLLNITANLVSKSVSPPDAIVSANARSYP